MGALQYNFWLVVYYIALLVTGIIAFFEAIVIAVIGDRYDIDYYVARTFKHFAQPIMGWYFDVTGEEHIAKGTGPAVLLGNHQRCVRSEAWQDKFRLTPVLLTFSTSEACSQGEQPSWRRRRLNGFQDLAGLVSHFLSHI